MIFLSWDLSKDVGARYSKSALHKFLQEAKIKEIVEGALDEAFSPLFREEDGSITREDVLILRHSRIALWVSDIKTKKIRITDEEYGEYEYEDDVWLGGVIAEFDTDDARKAMEKVIAISEEEALEDESVTRQIAEYGGVKIRHYRTEDSGYFEETCFFELDGKYVIAFSLDEAKKSVRLLKDRDAESLAGRDLYRKTMKNLVGGRVITVFLDMKRLFKTCEKEILEDEDEKRAFEFLRLGDMTAIGLGALATGEQVGLEVYLHTPHTNSPLFGLFRNSRTAFESMELVQEEALMAIAGALQPEECWEFCREAAKVFDEKSFLENMGKLAKLEKESGLSFKKDFLAHIGTEGAMIMPDPDLDLTSTVPLGVVLAVRIKDKDKIQQFVRAAGMTATGEKPEEENFKGYKMFIYDDLVFCFTEKYWLIGSSEEVVREIVKTIKGNRTLLINSMKYKKVRGKIKGDVTVLGYVNLARFFETINRIRDLNLGGPKGGRELESPPQRGVEGHSGKSGRLEGPPPFPANLFKKYFSSLLVGLKADENGILLKVLVPQDP